MRRSALVALALATAPPAAAPLAAQELGFLDLLTPDRLVQGIVQTGIMALRTQVDVTYGSMQIDLLSGRVTLTDIQLWPLPEWDPAGDCVIGIDRLTLRTNAFDEPERLRLRADGTGVRAPEICVPPDMREPLAAAGLGALDLPTLAVDLDYDVPSASAAVSAHATLTGAAAVALTADFAYLWFDGRDDMEEPEPVVFLDHAQLRIDDLGLWGAVQGLLPPPFADPAAATMMVPAMIGQALAEANRNAAAPDAAGDPSALGPAQRAFLDSLSETLPLFLAAPSSLVLETQVEAPGYLDLVAFEADPREIFETLRPVLSTAPLRRPELLSADLLRRALDGDAGLTGEERRRTGLALARGEGAPRNVAAALGLLTGLAETDGEAALALSDALVTSAPEEAYLWALKAGAAGAAGATAQLDRIETTLGLPRALALQSEVTPLRLEDGAADGVAGYREAAAAHLLGQARARSYPMAAAWALIGRAAGDREASQILDDLGDRARRSGAASQAAWAEAEAAASRAATDLWLARDLPARLAP